MSKSHSFRLPTKNFRALRAPHGNSKFGFFFVATGKVPHELWDWREVNPREVNTKTAVFKAISSTLASNPERFHERNRGITIVAETLSYDEKKQEVVLGLTDKTLHGVVDGAQEVKESSLPSTTDSQGGGASIRVCFSRASFRRPQPPPR